MLALIFVNDVTFLTDLAPSTVTLFEKQLLFQHDPGKILYCQKLASYGRVITLTTLKKLSGFWIVSFACVHVKWVQIGQTEIIQDSLNPKFSTPIIIDYHFEEIQVLQLEVWDEDDKKSKDLRKQGGELIGRAKTRLADVSLNENGD